MIIVQAAAVLAIALPTGGIMTTRQIYRETFVPDLTVSHFGLATTLRLDIEQTLFGLEEPSRPDPGEGSVSTLAPGNVSVQPEEPEEDVYKRQPLSWSPKSSTPAMWGPSQWLPTPIWLWYPSSSPLPVSYTHLVRGRPCRRPGEPLPRPEAHFPLRCPGR